MRVLVFLLLFIGVTAHQHHLIRTIRGNDRALIVQTQRIEGGEKQQQQVSVRPSTHTAHDPILWIVCPQPCALPAGVNVNTLRTRVTAGVAANNAGPLNGYAYVMNGAPGGGAFPVQGTVAQVRGNVPAAAGPPSNPSDAADAFCDAAWYWSAIGAQTVRNAGTYNTGHIVAAQLNGDNDEALNFFPHHSGSNTANGVWWRMEMIARHTRNFLALIAAGGGAACAGNPLQIEINFVYTANYNMIPQGGTYIIRIDQACAQLLAAVPAATVNNNWGGAPATGGMGFYYGKAAYRWVTAGPVGGLVGGNPPVVLVPAVAGPPPVPAHIQITTNWVNSAADSIVDGATGTGVGATHPNLYW